MINFAAESYSTELLIEMTPLWARHHKEVEQIRGMTLEPNLSMYAALSAAGVLRIFTARQEKELVGYQVFTITKHPHFKDMTQATMDILYLSPAARLGWMGYHFLKFVDDEFRKEGVNLLFRGISARHDFGPVLERIGYDLVDYIFLRRLS